MYISVVYFQLHRHYKQNLQMSECTNNADDDFQRDFL